MAKKKASRGLVKEGTLFKKYGAALASQILAEDEERLVIPTRLLAFNHQIGGGLPYGKILELFGEESSGKSLLGIDFAYCTQQLGGVVIWVDSEHALDRYWAKLNGLNLDRIMLFRESGIEKISDFIADSCLYWRSKLTKNEPILLVIDSIAALEIMANKNSNHEDGKADMGNRAKQIDKMLRIRHELLHDLGIGTIAINQLRSKIGASQFEDPDTTPGGKAMKFYASIRIGVYGGKQIRIKINGEEEVVGRVTSIRVKKNKVAPVRKTLKGVPVFFNPDYRVGFEKYFELPNLLVRMGAVKRKPKSSRYFDKAGNVIATSEEKFLAVLNSNEELRRKLIRKAGINTISTCQKKLESINKNLFPIAENNYEKHSEDESDN